MVKGQTRRRAKKKTRIIALTNQKGGVGKTTSVVNIGAGLTDLKCKILLVDLDPQAHLTYSLGINVLDLPVSLRDVLEGQADVTDACITIDQMALVPASAGLAAAEFDFYGKEASESILANILKQQTGYDFILIDCPAHTGWLTLNALIAAAEVFVPFRAEYLSLIGLKNLMEDIAKVKRQYDAAVEVTGIIVVQFDKRLKLHKEVLETLRSHFGDKVFKTYVRRNVAIAEAASFGQSIFEYAPRSSGAKDYRNIAREIKEMG